MFLSGYFDIYYISYKMELTKSAKIEINKKLKNHITLKLYKKIQKLKEYPALYGKPLRTFLTGI